MKVAVVCPYDLGRPGGVQDQAIRLVGWLHNAGHHPLLVGPGEEGPSGAVLLGRGTVIPANRSTAPIKLDPRVGAEVKRAVEGADVVHVHEPLMPVVSTAALRIKGVPLVATLHADPPRWVRAGYRLAGAALRSVLRNVAVLTAVSPVAGSAVDGVLDYRIIPNGIDVASYGDGAKRQERVTFLGRDDVRKGLGVMLEAWPRIRAAVPEATLHVLGAERDSTIEGVTFLGRVTEEEKRSELAVSAVHCAPNLGGESFGIVVVEAMASGCAVVASSILGFEYVAQGAATFAPPGDASSLADAVIGLLADPERRRQAGAEARDRAAHFDGPVVAAQYLTAYQDALGYSGRSR